MFDPTGRHEGLETARAAEGWSISRFSPPSRLHGANGIRTGADGRIYVAQVPGSKISAIDPDSGRIETICAINGPVTAPDDLVFDDAGNMFVTEITLGRVGMVAKDGSYRVVSGDVPVANPITMHQGRLIVGECFYGGRIMEIDVSTGAQRIILADAPMPNAFSVGADGFLYAPMMAVNEIWRIDLATGAHTVVAGELGVPDSVKFDSKGRIVSTQSASGEVLRIDVQSGAREVLAAIAPGLDNCTFVGERLFVSSISGQVNEILPGGALRSLVHDGLQWPMGLALAEDGALFVADGAYSYLYQANGQSGKMERQSLGFFFTPGHPGFARGVAADGLGRWLVSTANGQVMRWTPANMTSEVVSEGHGLLFGVARTDSGAAVFADAATGRVLCAAGGETQVLAEGLDRPMGIAIAPDGAVLAGEAAAGRLVRITAGGKDTLVDGLAEPQGIAIAGGRVLVLDVGSRELLSFAIDGSDRQVLASGLPVKAPPGITPKLLGGVGTMSGPMQPFAGIAIAADGTVYIAGDADGSVVALRPAD